MFYVLFASQALALQPNRYLVRFVDKVGTPYSKEAPHRFLSARSLARRKKHGCSVTEQDLPVSPRYVQGLQSLGIKVYFTSRWLNAAIVQVTSEQVARIDSLPYVSSVVIVAPGVRLEAARAVQLPQLPDPPQVASRLPLNHPQNLMLGVPQMHKMGIRGQGVLIAVTDSGYRGADRSPYFYTLHKEGRVLDSYDFVSNQPTPYHKGDHGSAVLSTMAAHKAGEFVGVAPEAQYALYITEDGKSEYRVEEYNWLLAAERADSLGADIIQTSLSYRGFDADTMSYSPELLDGKHAVVSRAVEMATQRGMLVVVAMGNSGERGMGAPAVSPSAISVAAVDANGRRAPFSSVGRMGLHIKPDVSAMGLYTVCLVFGVLSVQSGTSLAAPLVSGLAAGLWQAFPEKRNFEIADLLRRSADQADRPDQFRGFGVPNFLRACSSAGMRLRWHADGRLQPADNRSDLAASARFLEVDLPDEAELEVEAELLHVSGLLRRRLSDLRTERGQLRLNFLATPRGLYLLRLRGLAPESDSQPKRASFWLLLR